MHSAILPQEREPLLGASDSAAGTRESSQKATRKGRFLPNFATSEHRFRWIPLLGCLIILCNEAEWWTRNLAFMRMIEAMYCVEYWSERDPSIAMLGKSIPEPFCKDDIIQKNLARTAGLSMFFRMIPSMIGAIPIGYLADRYGRKPMLVIHKLNVCVSCAAQVLIYLLYPKLPIWTLYLTGLPGFFGGNFDTGLAVMFASYTDVIPSQNERASLFFLTTSMQYVAQVICPAVGAVLMNLDGKGGTPEIAFVLAFGGALTSFCLALFLYPETLPKSVKSKAASPIRSSRSKPDYSIIAQMKGFWSNLVDLMTGIGVGNILLLFLAILSVVTGTRFLDWYGLIQYPVIKLGWSLSLSSLGVSIQAVVMLANFSFLLPLYVRSCGPYFSPSNASLFIACISCFVLAIGATVTGFSSSATVFLFAMILYTLGEGAAVTIQAYVASLIDQSRLARVMGMLSIASIGGKMAASGGFQKVLAIGLDSHLENLVGLPFFFAAVLFFIAGTSVVIVAARA